MGLGTGLASALTGSCTEKENTDELTQPVDTDGPGRHHHYLYHDHVHQKLRIPFQSLDELITILKNTGKITQLAVTDRLKKL